MTTPVSFSLPADWEGLEELDQPQEPLSDDAPSAPLLHVAIGPDASYKIGTCEHCVLLEQGRPDRAWDANGDQDLDFDRDRYFALLARLGLVLADRQAYVCP